jgi:iron(III) transport system substrate-binding protein
MRAQNFGPPELIEAAKKEGKVVYYTADFAEVEQEITKAFNKRFPFVTGRDGARAGRPAHHAHQDGGRRRQAGGRRDRPFRPRPDPGLQDLLADYAPPNAADYREDVQVSPKIWPRQTLGWSIAYNTDLVKNPPKSWMDLTKPEYGNKQIGQVVGPSGGTTWTRTMFERQVLGDDYWKKQAAGRRLRSIRPARRCRRARCAARSRSHRCSTTSSSPRRRTARRSRSSSRRRACR